MIHLNASRTVVAGIAGLAVVSSAALSAPPVDVPIINPSFEDPPLDEGQFSNQGAPGWSDPLSGFGPINLPAFVTNAPVPDGLNVAYSNLEKDTVEQVLDVSLCEDDQITLRVAVGARNDMLTFGHYLVAMEAVAPDDSRTELASVSSLDLDAAIPAPGEFIEIELNASIKGDALNGHTLAIILGSAAVQPGEQTLFDDVRLTIQTTTLHVPDCVPTIQDAIDLAEDGDVIVLEEGIYPELLDFRGKAITLRSADPTDDWVVDSTVIVHPDAEFRGGLPSSLVTFTSGEGPDTVLEGVTLDGGGVDVLEGALVYIDGASPSIRNCIFLYGHADLRGGAMFIEESDTIVEDSMFVGNWSGLDAGAVYVGVGGSPNFIRCGFYENYADLGDGGAIYVGFNGDIELIECDFGYNNANVFGGAVCVITRRPTWITDCNFYDNYAQVGGAFSSRESDPMLMGCYFGGNLACRDGGAVFAYAGAPTLSQCEFENNLAGLIGGKGCFPNGPGLGLAPYLGGGAYAQNLGEATIEDCDFYANDAFFAGGAVSVEDVDLTLTDSRLSCNRSGFTGGGVNAVRGFASIRRSHFAGNETGLVDGYGLGGGVALMRYSGFQATAGDPEGGEGEPDSPAGEIVNSLFEFNSVDGAGGAISILTTGVDVANCTIAFNTAFGNDIPLLGFSGGGGIFAINEGSLSVDIYNSIIWGNSPDQIFYPNDPFARSNGGGPPTLAYSDIMGGVPIGVIDLGGNIDQNPLFVSELFVLPCDECQNGKCCEGPGCKRSGFVNDYRLRPNSPCIDAADTPALELLGGEVFDVALSDRVLDDTGIVDTGVAGSNGATVDMGAHEFDGVSDPMCNAADMAPPFGTLNFDDVVAFLSAFGAQHAGADQSEAYGVFDFDDVLAFIEAFAGGCDD